MRGGFAAMTEGEKFIAELTWQAYFGGFCKVEEHNGKIEARGNGCANAQKVFGMRGIVTEEKQDTFYIEAILLSPDGVWIKGQELDKVLRDLNLTREYTPSF